ncbi:tetratricopeptide repeat protein [Sphingobacterium rhinopitheci]|uniref:tetratricopeptide repeat protein n=1 Tax=Sphingobacterium rhinopitheci TaxID=2781960 RepID=UPI001F524B22|nr:tetratricopeptide repeat protein [Sphingobacterium rhinopitheci]MCI0920854.1 hypothetical protein [Sphingobacterium rhinopitheci]
MWKKLTIIITGYLMLYSCKPSNRSNEAIYLNNQAIKHIETNSDSAIYYFDKAIAQDPNYLLSYQNKANLLIKIKDYESALKVVDQLSKKMESSDIYQMKGILYDLNQDSSAATANYLKAITKIDNEVKRINDFAKYKKLYDKGTLYLLLNRTGVGIDLIKKYSKKANIADSRKDSLVQFSTNKDQLIHILIRP